MRKNKVVKTVLASAVALCTLLSLGACGRQAGSSNAVSDKDALQKIDSAPAKGDLTMWAMGDEGQVMPDFVAMFKKENPDVNIKVTNLPWSSYREKFQTAIASGTGPDISMSGNADLAAFAKIYSPAPSNFGLSDIPASLRAISNVKGKQIAIPFYADPRVMFYRTDIAQKAGWSKPATTWDEFRQMAKDMQKVDGVEHGVYIADSGTDCFQNFLYWAYSNKASLLNKEGTKYTVDTPEFKGALNYTTSLFKNGIADKNVDTETGSDSKQFVSGKTPIMFGVPNTVKQLKQAGGDGFESKFATAPLPKGKTSTSFVGGANMTVWKTSKNKQAAWKFIQWLLKPQTQVKFFKATTDLPASTKAAQDPVLMNDPKMVPFTKQVKDVKSVPFTTTYPQFMIAADKSFEQISKGQVNVDQGLADLQKQADSLGTEN